MTFSLGYKYYVLFIDAFSRYTWNYFIKTKYHTLSIFKQFQTMVERQLNHKIMVVQSYCHLPSHIIKMVLWSANLDTLLI